MITVKGRLYTDGKKVVANLGRDFGRFYLSLLPKAWYAEGQRHEAHVTIVRGFEKGKIGKKYSGTIDIHYDPMVYYEYPYYFMRCWSDDANRIRLECGLNEYRGSYKWHHITIGNNKLNTFLGEIENGKVESNCSGC